MKNSIRIIEFANEHGHKIVSAIVIILIAILLFIAPGCSIIKPQLNEPEEVLIEFFEFDDYARKIHHVNDRKQYTASLNWADVTALDIDSVTAKYIEYWKYHLRIKSVYP